MKRCSIGCKLFNVDIWTFLSLSLVICGLSISILVSGCSKSEENTATTENTTSKEEKPKATAKTKYTPALATSTIKGKINFEGKAPEPKKLDVSEKYCVENFYKDKPLYSEAVIVNSNNTLKNVIVYVKEGYQNWQFDAPSSSKTLDQNGCRYTPHVFALQVGETLDIINSDPFLHNIHTKSELNSEFNFGQPKQGMKSTRKFDQPELPVHFKCDVHSWMSAYAGIFEHPFFYVTGDEGAFEIKLPPGEYTIATWHEKYGTQSQKVKVEVNETKEINFTYKGE